MKWITSIDFRELPEPELKKLGDAVLAFLVRYNPDYAEQLTIVYPESNTGDMAWYIKAASRDISNESFWKMQTQAEAFATGYLKAMASHGLIETYGCDFCHDTGRVHGRLCVRECSAYKRVVQSEGLEK
jgi:hypothetical protein